MKSLYVKKQCACLSGCKQLYGFSSKAIKRKCGVGEMASSLSSVFGSYLQNISHFNFPSLSNIYRNTPRNLSISVTYIAYYEFYEFKLTTKHFILRFNFWQMVWIHHHSFFGWTKINLKKALSSACQFETFHLKLQSFSFLLELLSSWTLSLHPGASGASRGRFEFENRAVFCCYVPKQKPYLIYPPLPHP